MLSGVWISYKLTVPLTATAIPSTRPWRVKNRNPPIDTVPSMVSIIQERYITRKRKSCHCDEIVITGCTESCHLQLTVQLVIKRTFSQKKPRAYF